MNDPMSAPLWVKVGGRTYSVHSDADTSALTSDDGSRGMTFHERQRIHVDSTLGKDIFRETLIHECIHAAWDFVGLRKGGDVAQHEEQVIKALSPTITALIRDNPQLVRFITERD